MTYEEYLDGTSKMAIQALVQELDEAVRGAAERAVQPAVDQVSSTLRRLNESDEALRKELESLASHLPSHMQGLLETMLLQASQPAWKDELKDAMNGALLAQYERISEVAEAMRRLEGDLAALSGTVGRHGGLQEEARARMGQLEEAHGGLRDRLATAIERTEAALGRLAAADDGLRHELSGLDDRLGGRFQAMLERAVGERVLPAIEAHGGSLSAQTERFQALSGLLGQLREHLEALGQRLHHDGDRHAERAGMLGAALDALSGRLGAMGAGIDQALGQVLEGQAGLVSRVQALEDRLIEAADEQGGRLREVAQGVGAIEQQIERQGQALHGLDEHVQGALEATRRVEARVERSEESLLAGVLASEKRLGAEVRAIMQEVVAERTRPVIKAALEPVTERLERLEQKAGAVDQLREEFQTRHDAVIRVLENLNGRVVFDVEAQNKNAYLLEKLRRQGRWQMLLTAVLLGAVMLIFAFTFFQRTGLFTRF